MPRRTVRLATRGSDLALRQAGEVKAALEDRRYDVELVEVATTGDELREELIHRLGKTGAFVRSLDEKVLEGEVDAAVHSMKDVPTDTPAELVIAGIPKRGPPEDVLVTPDGTALEDLPEGATVGTSSLRRGALLERRRPDLDVEPLRGNVDTRIEKLLAPGLQREHERRMEAEDEPDEEGGEEGEEDGEAFVKSLDDWFDGLREIERSAMERKVDTEYDAIVLAKAGLERIGLADAVAYEELPLTEFVPAAGQGTLAITAREDDDLDQRLNDLLDHPRTRVETTVERTLLKTLGGGCVAPIGIHALVQGDSVRTAVAVLSRDGEETITATRKLPVERHPRAARNLGEELIEQGAGALVEAARREEPDEAKRD